ncbi:MAG TPA: hypothetical protein VEY95_14990 [Azospirillaceae bacterium]|nr:hypothetical protein [Azospirillaceae bacterium]
MTAGGAMTDANGRMQTGYGRRPPDPGWPGGARIAVQFALIDAVDDGADGIYGRRAGLWRLLRLFEERRLPLTWFAAPDTLAACGEAVSAVRDLGHEIASHPRANPSGSPGDLAAAFAAHARAVGEPPAGWYGGPEGGAADGSGLLYRAAPFLDDLPFWTSTQGGTRLVLPVWTVSIGTAADGFDQLHGEGQDGAPKLMMAGLTMGTLGRPDTASHLARFLDHVLGFEQVWICRAVDLARHWHDRFPPPARSGSG